MRWLLILVGALLGGVLYFASSRDPGDAPRTGSSGELPRREPEAGTSPAPLPAPAPAAFDDLLAIEAGAGMQAAAAALRLRLRTDAEARRDAEARLLAADTPRELRMVLAFVLGTLPGSDPVLREALARYRDDRDVARCLVFALGATREPIDDDDVFALGDRPWGAHGPRGLGITVRREIDDADSRALLQGCLADGRGGLREAAAIALRHTTQDAGVRSSFVSTLQSEPSDEVALVLGEALAGWAGSEDASGTERTQVIATLLSRAADEGLDGFRFRMEDDFHRIALDESSAATLVDYAAPSRPYAVRSFALTTLAAGAPGTARPLLEGYATEERDAAVRDLSTRLLGTLPANARSLDILAGIARDDEAWNVRYQAVDALARHKETKTAAAALEAATADADERVAKRARAALD